jgi:hypothetical protein
MLENLTTFDIILFFVGGVLLLKRVAEMERYHNLRVVVLTVILSCVGLFFLLSLVSLFTVPFDDCLVYSDNLTAF